MVGSTQRQASLLYLAFSAEVAKLQDELLDEIDPLLDDPELVEFVRQALGKRCPHSTKTGRYSIAPDRLLRCVALRHIRGWSFRELERELRNGLLYRRFSRFDGDPIPNFSNLCRNEALLGPEITEAIHRTVVRRALSARVCTGRKLRTDTTVVETDVHYPTDSTLLGDGIRVLTRHLKRLSGTCIGAAVDKVVDHGRAAKRRMIEIHRASKAKTDTGRARLTAGYRKLVRLTKGMAKQAKRVLKGLEDGEVAITADPMAVVTNEAALRHFVPLVDKVIDQTEQRVFGGDHHVEGKVLSLFEQHTAVIRKGKPHKPNEFGRLVQLDEVEGNIVSAYDTRPGNASDKEAFLPAIDRHKDTFGRVPDIAAADRGFFSANNERKAKERRVRRVAIAGTGRLSKSRARRQKERWFRRAQRWRAGIEPRISTLKHRFGMLRARAKGEQGFKRYVGWCVIANNLVSIANKKLKRKKQRRANG
jgi:IS5 family transposase